MNYLVNPAVSKEIDGRVTDPLTGNLIGAAIDAHRAVTSRKSMALPCFFEKLHCALGPGLLTNLAK